MGVLIARLKETEAYENTNIIIVSDHGLAALNSDNAILIQDYLNISTINSSKTVYGIVSNIHAIPGSVTNFLLHHQ